MTNPLNLNAPVDTLAMELTRDFNAPVEALFRAHADLVLSMLQDHLADSTIRGLWLHDPSALSEAARALMGAT